MQKPPSPPCRPRPLSSRLVAFLSCLAALGGAVRADDLPTYLDDRGPGLTTSLFGTYIEKGEWLVYPFYEYVKNTGDEYHPSELGYVGDTDYLGESVEHEYLLFVAYGFTDWLAVELEGAVYATASLEKPAEDTSDVPPRIEESGLGEVESQVRWRWAKETERRPELFSFFEVAYPLQKDNILLGEQDWEFGLGFGVVKGFDWGTITGRVQMAYSGEESKVELGEYDFEYLKRVSEGWRLVASLEGEDDEISLIGEAQWHFSEHAFLKLNCGFGLTEKAPDIAPEVGVMFRF